MRRFVSLLKNQCSQVKSNTATEKICIAHPYPVHTRWEAEKQNKRLLSWYLEVEWMASHGQTQRKLKINTAPNGQTIKASQVGSRCYSRTGSTTPQRIATAVSRCRRWISFVCVCVCVKRAVAVATASSLLSAWLEPLSLSRDFFSVYHSESIVHRTAQSFLGRQTVRTRFSFCSLATTFAFQCFVGEHSFVYFCSTSFLTVVKCDLTNCVFFLFFFLCFTFRSSQLHSRITFISKK